MPSYVRCIKPNDTKQAGKFDEAMVRHQIKYLGLVENVRVRRAGFCFRESIDLFFWRYKLLSSKTYPTWKGSAREGTEVLLADMGINPRVCRCGSLQPLYVFRCIRWAPLKSSSNTQPLCCVLRVTVMTRSVFVMCMSMCLSVSCARLCVCPCVCQ